MSRSGLFRVALAGALALALAACGSAATPTPAPTPVLPPTASPTATPTPAAVDVATEFLARILAARSGSLGVSGSISVDTAEVPVTGTITISGEDSQSIITLETPGASQTQQSIRIGTQQWNSSGGGPWLLNPTPNDRTKSLSAFLRSLTSLEDRGVATHGGRQLQRLVPPASATISPEALGFTSPGMQDTKIAMEFWAEADGSPAAWSFDVTWNQAAGATTVAARLVMDLDLAGLGRPATVAAPGNVWERFSSERFGYSMAHPAGWTVTEAEGQDSYLADGTPYVFVAPSDRAGYTLERYSQEVLALYVEQLGAKLERDESITLDGQPARFVTYRFKASAQAPEVYVAEVLALHGDMGWDIFLTDQGRTEADGTPVFEAMISTFTFTK